MNKLIDFLIDTMNKVNGMDIRAGDIINYRTTREVRQGTVMMVLRIEDTRIPGEKRGSMLYLVEPTTYGWNSDCNVETIRQEQIVQGNDNDEEHYYSNLFKK